MATRYWVGGSGTWNASSTSNWSTTSNGSPGASAPTSVDTVVFDSSSGSGTVTVAPGAACTVATHGAANITIQLATALTMTGGFTLTFGILDLQSYILTCNSFISNNSNARTVAFGTGKIVVTGNNTTVISCGTLTNFSYTGISNIEATYSGSTGTRSINIGSTGGSEARSMNVKVSAGSDALTTPNGSVFRNFDLTGFTGTLNNNSRTIYGNCLFGTGMTVTGGTTGITFAGTSGTQQITTNNVVLDLPLTFSGIGGTFAFQDALTQGTTRAFTVTNGTVQLKAGATSTVGAFTTSGANRKNLQSTTAGSRATLSQASGTVNASYLTIQDINATGGATWNALYSSNNIDAGNNLGWNFGDSPQTVNEVTYRFRSFTTPRRF